MECPPARRSTPVAPRGPTHGSSRVPRGAQKTPGRRWAAVGAAALCGWPAAGFARWLPFRQLLVGGVFPLAAKQVFFVSICSHGHWGSRYLSDLSLFQKDPEVNR